MMSELSLSCNFPKCKAQITHLGLSKVTRCSHIFCDIHKFNETGFNKRCPACGSILNSDYDVVDSNLQLPEELKSTLLVGLQPEMIFDVMSRGLQFWSSQMQDKQMHYRAGAEYLRSRLAAKEGMLERLELDVKHYIEMQQKKVEYLKNEVNSLNDALKDVESQLEEKNRQLFNMQSRYDALRRQSVSSILNNEPEPMEFETLSNNPYQAVRSAAFTRNRQPAPPTPVFEFRPSAFGSNPNNQRKSFLQTHSAFQTTEK